MEKIVIIGCGGHAKSVVDIIESMGTYEIVGFVDKQASDYTYRGYKIIASDADVKSVYDTGVTNAAMGIGFMGGSSLRNDLYDSLKKIGFAFPALVDASAAVAGDAVIGEGAVVGKNAVINSDAKVGAMAIINSAAVVEHDCEVGDFAHIAVGTVLCGGVKVGNNAFIGANATVIQELKVAEGAVIGAGSTVIGDVASGNIVVGTPARKIRG